MFAADSGLHGMRADVPTDGRPAHRAQDRTLLLHSSLLALLSRGAPARATASDPHAAAVGTLAALTFQNARLQDAERRTRQQLEAVRDVTAQVTRSLDLDRTLERIARHVGPLLGDAAGSVWLWDDAAQRLVPLNPGGDEPRTGGERVAARVAAFVAHQRRGATGNDVWPPETGGAPEAEPVPAVIGEPLLYRERLLGALIVMAESRSRRFSAEDAELLKLFAAHASIAIANAQLFGQIQADHADLRRLSQQLVEVQEAERRALARELHDEIGQALTALGLLLEVSADAAAPANRKGLEDAQELVRGLLSRVRQLSLDLRPGMLDDLGLIPALLWLVEHYQARTGIRIDFRHAGLEGRRFSTEVETAAYRVVQEALTNVARHAGVREAVVRLCLVQEILEVQVEDRGRGFDAEAAARKASTGLQGMRERAALLGGAMTVDTAPGRGTCIQVQFPLAPGLRAAALGPCAAPGQPVSRGWHEWPA